MQTIAIPLVVDAVKMSKLFPPLASTIASFNEAHVAENRLQILRQIVAAVNDVKTNGRTPNLMFVCTHNSRRSQLAEAWSHAFSQKYGLNISSSSGGTEATSFVENATQALQSLGFNFEIEDGQQILHVDDSGSVAKMFSKTWDNSFNPQSDVVAVMVCSHAEENCPFIPGAVARISLPFNDPKQFDGTEKARDAYKQTALLIGTELHALYNLITNN